jgi:hypothetical protein
MKSHKNSDSSIELDKIHQYLKKYSEHVREQGKRFGVDGEFSTRQMVGFLGETIQLRQVMGNPDVELLFHLILPNMDEYLTVSLNPKFTGFLIHQVQPSLKDKLESLSGIASIAMFLAIDADQEEYTIDELINQIKWDTNRLDNEKIRWKVRVSFPKGSLDVLVRNILFSIGVESDIMVFINEQGFLDCLKSETHLTLFDRALSSKGNLIVAIGDLHATIFGKYLALVDLWELPNYYTVLEPVLNSLQTIEKEYRFLTKVGPTGHLLKLVVPDFFELDFEGVNYGNALYETLHSLVMLYALIAFSSYATNIDAWNIWNLKIFGNKMLETNLVYKEGNLIIDGIKIERCYNSLMNFFHWTYDGKDDARVFMARKTIALHSSNYMDFINNLDDMHTSTEAGFQLYLDQVTAEILEAKLKFIEFTQDWTNKDTELRVKLDRVMYENLYGGFAAILGSIFSLISQYNSQISMRIILAALPILFILYLLIGVIRTERLVSVFETYLDQHMRHISYYRSILGENIASNMAGSLNREEFEEDFKKKRKENLIAAILLSVVSMCSFIGFILFGLIP